MSDTPEKPISQLVQEDRIKREQACSEEINSILEKYECVLAGEAVLRSNQMPGIRILITSKV